MQERGVYICVSVFPAVAHNHAGICFTISLNNTAADIDRLMRILAAEVKRLGLGSIEDGRAEATRGGALDPYGSLPPTPATAPRTSGKYSIDGTAT